MAQRSLPAVFMRGGTSKAIIFHERDLPASRSEWDAIFLGAMGSPDPNGRQLNGMGGGVSSLSKVCVVGPSERSDADVNYTFAQILIGDARVEYKANCGNMSSAIGPFAIDEGLLFSEGDTATVRIFNTNTGKIIHATFPQHGDRAAYDGDLTIPGVSGSGAPIRLDFLDPGGALTGKLLPTGNTVDRLDIPGLGTVEVSLIDAANALVFVRAQDVGMTGKELPADIAADKALMQRLADVRAHGAVAMGISRSYEDAQSLVSTPTLAIISPASDWRTISGEPLSSADMDLTIRIVSSNQPHLAIPVTSALCTGVASLLSGTVVADMLAVPAEEGRPLRLGMPSGILTVGAAVERDEQGGWKAKAASFYRTARRLFDGRVWLP